MLLAIQGLSSTRKALPASTAASLTASSVREVVYVLSVSVATSWSTLPPPVSSRLAGLPVLFVPLPTVVSVPLVYLLSTRPPTTASVSPAMLLTVSTVPSPTRVSVSAVQARSLRFPTVPVRQVAISLNA